MEARWVPVRGRSAGRDRGDVGEYGEEASWKRRRRSRSSPRPSRRCGRGSCRSAKAEAIAAAADVAPEAEDDLFDGAEDAPLAEVREKCLRARGKDRERRTRGSVSTGRCKEFTDAEGAWNVIARGTAEAGAAFRAAHRPIVDELFKAGAGRGPSRALRGVRVRRVHRARPPRRQRPDRRRPNGRPEPSHRAKKRQGEGDAGELSGGSSGSTTTALARGSVEGDEVCEIAGPRTHPGLRRPRALGRRDPQARDHQGRRRHERHPPRTLGHRRPAGRAVVAVTRCARVEGCTRTLPPRERPPRRLGQHPPHPPRRDRPALRTPPRPQDPPRLGARRRHRHPTMVPPHDPRHPKNKPPPATVTSRDSDDRRTATRSVAGGNHAIYGPRLLPLGGPADRTGRCTAGAGRCASRGSGATLRSRAGVARPAGPLDRRGALTSPPGREKTRGRPSASCKPRSTATAAPSTCPAP